MKKAKARHLERGGLFFNKNLRRLATAEVGFGTNRGLVDRTPAGGGLDAFGVVIAVVGSAASVATGTTVVTAGAGVITASGLGVVGACVVTGRLGAEDGQHLHRHGSLAGGEVDEEVLEEDLRSTGAQSAVLGLVGCLDVDDGIGGLFHLEDLDGPAIAAAHAVWPSEAWITR